MQKKGHEVDIIKEFTSPLPITVIATMLGYYGLSEIFYTLPSQSGKFNVTVKNPDNSGAQVCIVHDGIPGV